MMFRSLRALRSSTFAALLALSPACESAHDESSARPGDETGGTGGASETAGRGAAGGQVGGAANGAASGSGGRGGAAGRAGATAGGASSGGKAGRASTGGATGGGGMAGSATAGGRAGSAAIGGQSGGGASAGDSAFGGAAGEPEQPNACADPFETVDVSALAATDAFDPYVVTGTSANQIRQSIDQNRGMDYDAYTSWYLTWRFDDCFGNGLVVTADITYRFPEWDEPASASADLVTSWETYMDALFCHEYGHAEHGLDCANDVFAALSAIDAGGDCDEQQAEADAAFDSILSEYQELDVQYDAETGHGATMGAVFPP